jgi:FKBP-type peptidyl-prolyl cis-trans isomerase SlyD
MTALPVASDTFVTLSYVLFDERGEAVDRATEESPLEYVHGYAQIVPGLERCLEGMVAGERRAFTIDSAEAFGDRDDEAVFEVDKADFPEGEVGMGDEFVAEGPDGEPIAMRVVEVLDDAYVVDTNHPLAGQRVRFEVAVSAVRLASEDEIARAQTELEERLEDHDGACCEHDGPHDHADHAPHDHDDGLLRLSRKP